MTEAKKPFSAVRVRGDWRMCLADSGIGDCGAVLRELRPLVLPRLVDARGWKRLLARADGLPASALGFEVWLGEPAREVDFIIGYMAGSAVERAWMRRGQDAESGPPEAALARHLRDVGAAVAPLRLWTMHEYDAAPVSGAPPPGLFQGVFPQPPEWSSALDAGRAGCLAVALARAVGWAADAEEAAAVERLTAVLPPPAVVNCVGAMPGRKPRSIRILIENIDPDRLAETLARIDWPGSPRAVLAAVEPVRDICNRFKLQLAVTAEGPLPGVGVELYTLPKPNAGGPTNVGGSTIVINPKADPWHPVFARLDEAGWSLPWKSRELLKFPGCEHVFADGIFEVCTWINHVKLAIDGDRRAAKAYAGLRYRPIEAADGPSR